MANLNFIISLIFFLTTINPFSNARTLTNPTPSPSPTPSPTPTPTHHYKHPKIKFLMQNVLNVTQTLPNPRTTKIPIQIPFPKPRGYFPPNKGIPLPPSFVPISSNNYNNIGMPFLPKAAPHELEFGSVTQIDEHLFKEATTMTTTRTTIYGHDSLIVGKAEGMFVGSSENGSSHMVAFTASFGNGFKDGLRFFGVYKAENEESHVAVIGGIGKYEGANGYAAIKAIDGSYSTVNGEQNLINKLLSFNVYLS